MPLRDHFRSPLDDVRPWSGLHALWTAVIVQHLMKILPEPYFAEPGVHLRTTYEIDVGTFQEDGPESVKPPSGNGGIAVATYAPPRMTLTLQPQFPSHEIYEVRIYDSSSNRRLIAAIEIISPSNKDRPESRGAFVSTVAELLRQDVCVSIVDVVTTRNFNLYGELLRFLESVDPALGDEPPPIYAVTLRMRYEGHGRLMDAWYHPLAIGQPLPTLPIWLKEAWAIPLELEASYEETCQTLRIR